MLVAYFFSFRLSISDWLAASTDDGDCLTRQHSLVQWAVAHCLVSACCLANQLLSTANLLGPKSLSCIPSLSILAVASFSSKILLFWTCQSMSLNFPNLQWPRSLSLPIWQTHVVRDGLDQQQLCRRSYGRPSAAVAMLFAVCVFY